MRRLMVWHTLDGRWRTLPRNAAPWVWLIATPRIKIMEVKRFILSQ